MTKYYQPEVFGSRELPEELNSFEVFHTKEECQKWLWDNGYFPNDFDIIEYEDGDIEDYTFVNDNEDNNEDESEEEYCPEIGEILYQWRNEQGHLPFYGKENEYFASKTDAFRWIANNKSVAFEYFHLVATPTKDVDTPTIINGNSIKPFIIGSEFDRCREYSYSHNMDNYNRDISYLQGSSDEKDLIWNRIKNSCGEFPEEMLNKIKDLIYE